MQKLVTKIVQCVSGDCKQKTVLLKRIFFFPGKSPRNFCIQGGDGGDIETLPGPTGILAQNTVEAPVSGHPREAEKVSATGAGRLQEYRFCMSFVKAAVSSCPLTRVFTQRASTVVDFPYFISNGPISNLTSKTCILVKPDVFYNLLLFFHFYVQKIV